MRILKGLSAAIATLAIIVGVPMALWACVGNPLPGLSSLPQALTRPDFGGEILFGTILPLLAWMGWAWLTIGLVIEIGGALARVKIRRITFFSPAQGLGSFLVGSILAMSVTAGLAAPAQAAPTAPLSSHSASSIASTPQSNPASAPATQVAPAQSAKKLPTVTVKQGQTLWGLAEEYLGDGTAFKEIAELNYGTAQPDGGSLTRANVIQPGWVLTLPARATKAIPQMYTVRAGDTLSDIAGRFLEDPSAYERILALNPTITNANEINPGQKIRLPQTTNAPAKKQTPAQHHKPAKESPAATAGKPHPEPTPAKAAKNAPTTPQTPTPAPSQAPRQTPQETAPAPAPAAVSTPGSEVNDTTGGLVNIDAVRTIGGIGGTLAAGLLALLGARRWNQRRHRKAGSTAPAVTAPTQQVENRLREVEEPLTVAQIDETLRYLASWAQKFGERLPDLFCVRAAAGAPDFTIYVAEPTDLPLPFVAVTEDFTVWQVDPRDLPDVDGPRPSAPYPALTTVGHDQSDGTILLDLEYLGALGVQGAPERSSQVMNALAVELGVTPWGEELQVTLVGFLEDLPAALGTGRVRHFSDLASLTRRLEGRAKATAADLAELGVGDLHEARAHGQDAQSWTPEIVLIAGDHDAVELERVRSLALRIPRLGVAAVIAGESEVEWQLRLGDGMDQLLPVGLELVLQTLSGDEAASVIELLRGSSVDRGEAVAEGIPAELSPEPILSVVPQAEPEGGVAGGEGRGEDGIVSASLGEPDLSEEVEPAPAAVAEIAPVLSEVLEAGDSPVVAGVDELGQAAADGEVDPGSVARPLVRILGPVDVLNATGSAPVSPHTGNVSAQTLARCQALLAFVTLHPGATSEMMHEAFWPNANPSGSTAAANRNKLTNLTRKYLGEDENGTPYMPHAASGYRLDERVQSDWELFKHYIGPNPAYASTPRLIAALRLVRGAPFDGAKPKNFLWNEQDKSFIIDAVCDAAHVLMKRALETKDEAAAGLAARVGRTVDPANEQMWRNQMLAEHLAGNMPGIEATFQKLVSYLDSFGEEYEPEPETTKLHEALTHDRRVAS